MSGLPPKTDPQRLITACRMSASCYLMHRSKQSQLFDHLVGDAALDFKEKELKVPYWVFSETSEGRMVDFLYDGNVYALDGKLVGHLDGDGLTAVPDAFAQFFTKAVRN